MTRIAASLVALLTFGACNDNVGFILIRLDAPAWSPAIKCDKDPRRIKTISATLACETRTFTSTFPLEGGSGSISGVPLETCDVTVRGLNVHGRAVLSGSAPDTVVRAGDGAGVTVQLVEDKCDLGCDGDQDGLANADERAMKLDPSRTDTDGDGLADGFELRTCCSDPTTIDTCSSAGLEIQSVVPAFGPPATSVTITAGQAVGSTATARLGGEALTSPNRRERALVGAVSGGALLGDVVLSSGSASDTWDRMFAVLSGAPESTSGMDRSAGANASLMQRLADVTIDDTRAFLLGRSASSDRGIVLIRDHVTQGNDRAVIPTVGTPVALAVAGDRLVALVREGLVAKLAVYAIRGFPTAAARIVEVASRARRAPVGLALERSGDVAFVLFGDAIARVSLTGSNRVAAPLVRVRAPNLPGVPRPPGGSASEPECVGLAIGAQQNHAYLTCNAKPAGCVGSRCAVRGYLARVGPVARCVPTTGTPRNDPSCWGVAVAANNVALGGSPVVDAQVGRVYVLARGRGLSFAGLVWTNQRNLAALLTFPWTFAAGPRLLAPGPGGFLFAIDGNTMLRLAPRNPRANAIRRFAVNTGGNNRPGAVAVDARGTTIAIGRGTTASSLLSVCLSRCASCACK